MRSRRAEFGASVTRTVARASCWPAMKLAARSPGIGPLLAALLLAVSLAAPAHGAERFSMNLYREGDFASQATKKLCVGGAMQTMLNIVGPRADTDRQHQLAIWQAAADLSEPRYGGSTEEGWARGLTALGAGPYVVGSSDTLEGAIHQAAAALRQTSRPVGLLTWRGAHSWVMHGFKATADPLLGPGFTVTDVFVSDPWYPRVSSIWGASRGPDALVAVEDLAPDFLPWRPYRRTRELTGRYVLVLPTPPLIPLLPIAPGLVPPGAS